MENPINEEFKYLLEKVNNYSHAYIFETNSLEKAYQEVLKLAKKILDADEKISELIDNNAYDDLLVINPSTISIKKDELENLMNKFANTSVNNGKRVYIVYGFERIDLGMSNKLLKFIEEPDNNIHALLLTQNINKILPTIISRCQNIKLLFDREEDNSYNDLIDSFFKSILDNQYKTISYTNSLIFDKISDRKEMIDFFSAISSKLLKELELKYKGNSSSVYNEYTIDNLIKIIAITNKLSSIIKNNINLNLLIDRYIIEVVSVINNEERSGNFF